MGLPIAPLPLEHDALSVEPYGIRIPKGDPQFKRLADDVITGLFRSGEIWALYKRWFQSPIPPKSITLGLPPFPAMQRLVAHPTDSPDPAAYP